MDKVITPEVSRRLKAVLDEAWRNANWHAKFAPSTPQFEKERWAKECDEITELIKLTT